MELTILLKVIFSLLVVVGLLFAFSYLLKNYVARFGYGGDSQDIKIRDIKFLSKDKGLLTFEFDDKIFLAAFDNTKISVLHKKDINQGKDGQDS